ncbi:MAG: hypothetical protein ACRCWR_08385, partial [Saezia sp.]
MKKHGRFNPWKGVARILGITFFFSCLAGQGVTQEIELNHDVASCANTHYERASEDFKWPNFSSKVALDQNCWVSIDVLQQKMEGIVFVDVRALKAQQAHPLQDVLVLPLHNLQDDMGLRDKQIILIGTGFDHVSLNQTCMQLQEQGMDVRALQGGARALMGSPMGQHSGIDSAQISASEFTLGSASIPWKLVTFGLDEDQIAHLPQEPWEQDVDQAAKLFTAQTVQQIEYVLIAPDERSTRALQQSIGKAGLTGTVWLQGGLEAYENYIEEQQA